MTPPTAITMSGLGTSGPAAGQANSGSTLTSKMTGGEPAISDQSSGFIAFYPASGTPPRVYPNQ